MKNNNRLKTITTTGLALTVLGFSVNATLTFAASNETAKGTSTLSEVQSRGYLRCGVSPGVLGFSQLNSNNKWAGLDVDFCRSVAAATLGDANKVK